MGHGGKRAGAGRKRKIEYPIERWIVGRRCEEKRMEEVKRRRESRFEKKPQVEMLAKRLDQKVQRFGDMLKVPAWEMQKLRAEFIEADIDFQKDGRRYYRRLKGCRDAIITAVAKETGHPKRMVQRCWVEYRASLKQADDPIRRSLRQGVPIRS